MEITFKFGDDEMGLVQQVLALVDGNAESTNEKIDKKMKEEKEKTKKKSKKKTTKKKKEEETEEESGLTEDDVKEACKQHAEEFGKRKTKKVIKKFADSGLIADVDEDDYAKLIAKLVEEMEED